MKFLKGKKLLSLTLAGMLLATAAPFAAAATEGESDTTIRIVHTNDIHGYYKSTDRGQIGFDGLKTVIDEQDADLVLDIGDTFHGQAFATVEEGMSIARLMDECGYDAMTPGNHDWTYTAERLKELEDQSSFKILAANVVNDDGSLYFDSPYLVKDVVADDGTQLKVGVVGAIDDKFYTSTVPSNVEGLQFTEEAAKVTEMAQTLRNDENCDIVIAITHQSDCEGFVNNISGVDAVIAGHEHVLIDTVYQDSEGKDVPLVEANYYFYNVGVLSLNYDTQTGTVTADETFLSSGDTSGKEDAEVASVISEIEQEEQSVLSEVVGTSSKDYPYSWEEIRISEQEIGRIVTASYLDWTGADVAFENAGGVRAGISQGDVTYGDLISISPYGNVLVTKELTGQQIIDILEYSLEISRQCDEIYTLQKEAVEAGEDPYQYSWPEHSGSALQTNGVQANYDLSQPEGSKLSDVKIGGEPIELDKVYTVAMNNYVSDDTEYPHISTTELKSEYGTCEEALHRYIGKGSFEQAAATQGLVPVSAEDPTDPSEPTEPATQPETEPTTEETTPTEATGDTSATGATEAASTPKDVTAPTGATSTSGKVATGDSANVAMLLLVLAAAVGVVVFARKKGDNV